MHVNISFFDLYSNGKHFCVFNRGISDLFKPAKVSRETRVIHSHLRISSYSFIISQWRSEIYNPNTHTKKKVIWFLCPSKDFWIINVNSTHTKKIIIIINHTLNYSWNYNSSGIWCGIRMDDSFLFFMEIIIHTPWFFRWTLF